MALLKFLVPLLVACAWAQEEYIYNLDVSETLKVPLSGIAKFKISADISRGIAWLPKGYEAKLTFTNVLGQYVSRDGLPDYQVFTVMCLHTCKVNESFTFSMMKTSTNHFGPSSEHAVMVLVVEN